MPARTGSTCWYPPDAAELKVQFQSSSTEEVDLYVRRDREVWSEPRDTGETPRIRADFESASRGAREMIVITRESTPTLANAVHYIGLAVPQRQQRIRGTLSVQIRRSGIVRARPRALTFVAPAGSDPGPQKVRLTHETTGAVRYRIDSNAGWLRADPQEWVHAGTGAQEISITVNSAGMALDTHGGRLAVLQAGSGGASDSWTPTGVEIPVALAVVPTTGGSAASRRSNRVTIESRPHNGDAYGAGEEIRVSVGFANPVRVAGSPALALGVGIRTRQAAWNEIGTTSICEGGYKRLDFRYVVQADDRDADGISIAADALTLNDGSLRNVDGTASILALARPAIGAAARHKVDGSKATAPEVSRVRITSRPQDGIAYGAGEVIRAYVEFSVPLKVAGDPTLTLAVGDGTRLAALDWTGDRSVGFSYSVQADDRDADGIGIGADALALNGGSIRSAAGADAVLDLGGHAVFAAAGHKVDGSKATAPEVSGVRITSRPQDGIVYGAGEVIRAYVEFSVPLKVAGDPTLTLAVGDGTRLAALDWTGDRSVGFSYSVQADDRDADGIGIGADALALNGGSIRSAAGADAVLDLGGHAVFAAAGHKVDGSKATAPEVSQVRIASQPQDGIAYGAGEVIRAYVEFSVPVEVAGTPTLALAVGDGTRLASLDWTYDGGVVFSYAVQADDRDADGIGIGADALALNGGSIRSVGGAEAELDLGGHAVAAAAGHKVDGSKATAPEVSRVWITSRPRDGIAYGAGEVIRAYVDFSVSLEVAGTPTLALVVGQTSRSASFYAPSTDGTALFFAYTVQADDRDADGIGIGADALALNGGSIRSAAGADAVLDLGGHAVFAAAGHKVDGSKATAPEVSQVRIASQPQDGIAYGAGEVIRAYVEFSVPVEVAGTPTLALAVGDGTRLASLDWTYDGGVVFSYAVQADDRDADGIGIGADALALNGGSIRGVGGAEAELDLGGHAVAAAAGHKVDGSKATVPEVSGVWITSRPRDGIAYGAGEVIRAYVDFSVSLEVAGTPTLALVVGQTSRSASFYAPSTDGTALFFAYTVQADDRDADGISIGADALALNGGSIRSVGGAEAELDLGGHAVVNAADHKVDGGG